MTTTTPPRTYLRPASAIRRDVAEWFQSNYPRRPDLHRAGGHRLLMAGEASAKLRKSAARTVGLSMPPERLWWNPEMPGAISATLVPGWQYLGNVCPWEDGCRVTCIASTGHYGMGQSATRLWVRVLWHHNRAMFLELLGAELAALDMWAHREARRTHRAVHVATRLNVTSDIDWARYIDMVSYRRLRFYDYTKSTRRAMAAPGSAYDLTLSVSRSVTVPTVRAAIRRGVRVAVVVPDSDAASATSWSGIPAVNGDDSDARYLDPPAVAVLLRVKRSTDGTDAGAIYRSGMVRDAAGNVLGAIASVYA